MTEIALRPTNNGLATTAPTMVALAPDNTYERLARWAEAATAAHRVAESLVRTAFVPEAFRNKPDEATAAILAGMELGFSPMAAMGAFDVIQGRAAPKAITLRAVVQSRGHKIWQEGKPNAERAVVLGQRKGETEIHRSEWTMERARGLGLVGKDNWKKQPGAMLLARATAECARLTAADAILGVPYSSEELEDGDAAVVQVAPARVTREEILGQPTATVPDDYPMTQEQSARLRELFAERGTTDPQAALAHIATVIGRSCPWAELTAQEAGLVIANLQTPTAAEDPIADLPISKPGGRPITEPQRNKIMVLAPKIGLGERDLRLEYISGAVDRPVSSTNDLSSREAGRVIEMMEAAEKADAEARGSS